MDCYRVRGWCCREEAPWFVESAYKDQPEDQLGSMDYLGGHVVMRRAGRYYVVKSDKILQTFDDEDAARMCAVMLENRE